MKRESRRGGPQWPPASGLVAPTARRALIAAGLTAALSAASGTAVGAPTKRQCLENHQKSQVLRQSGELKEARGVLEVCADNACPSLIERDCISWLEELSRTIPTVVIRATANGQDVFDVKVFVDGALVAERLDGDELELDPGRRSFRLVKEGLPPVEQDILVTKGERRRILRFTIRDPEAEKAAEAERRRRAEEAAVIRSGGPAATPMHRPIPTGVWVSGAVGLVGLASFGALAIVGELQRSDLEDQECRPFCDEGEVGQVRGLFMGADVSLGIGIAGLATAGLWYLFRPSVPVTPEERPELEARFFTVPGGGALGAGGTF